MEILGNFDEPLTTFVYVEYDRINLKPSEVPRGLNSIMAANDPKNAMVFANDLDGRSLPRFAKGLCKDRDISSINAATYCRYHTSQRNFLDDRNGIRRNLRWWWTDNLAARDGDCYPVVGRTDRRGPCFVGVCNLVDER
jgi:hypothetical protein